MDKDTLYRVAKRKPVPVYGARRDKVNIERGGHGYCIVILFKLGQVIGRAYKYLECNGCPDRGGLLARVPRILLQA